MCVMEVRAGQHHSTIAQAEAHNINTVVQDLDMFAAVLDTRGEPVKAQRIREIQERLSSSYEDLLDLYCGMLAAEVHDEAGHLNLGGDREYESVFELVHDVVHRDIKHAAAYETR